MKAENPTMTLINMLVKKHNLDFNLTLAYIRDEAPKSVNMKLFFSGFIHSLSTKPKLRNRLSVNNIVNNF